MGHGKIRRTEEPMKPALLIFAALFCLCAFGNARAQNEGDHDSGVKLDSGIKLQEMCKYIEDHSSVPVGSPEAWRVMFCTGFIDGMVQGHDFWVAGTQEEKTDPLSFCFPTGSTTDQIIKVFAKYLDDHPEELHKLGVVLFAEAMHKAFPCK
jgi:hypothetical protein